jgi:hypothetical protein
LLLPSIRELRDEIVDRCSNLAIMCQQEVATGQANELVGRNPRAIS